MATSSSGPSAAFASETTSNFSYKGATEDEILEDLTSRFILNLPDEELTSLERICFQVEQAHWYYEDFIREENPRCPSLALRKFTAMMFTNCPVLQHWNHDEAFDKFMKYKTKVPVCGAIMLNDTWDKCVLVKGWKSSSGWGFPKGKINETEEKYLCAVREVLEETGYNLAGQIDPQHYLETVNNGQVVTLFIVANVPEDYPFRTKTRKEISKIEWFRLVDLPGWKRAKQTPGKFYLITPFIHPLKAYINTNKPRKGRKGGVAEKPAPSEAKPPIPVPKPPPPQQQPQPQQQDDTLQDSSSQSSSLDNGDPQTPSPQYSESTPAFVPEIVGDQREPAIPIESLDPHFARLLSGLSMSVVPAKKEESQVSTPQNPLNIFDVLSPPSSTPNTSSIPNLSPIPSRPDPINNEPSPNVHPSLNGGRSPPNENHVSQNPVQEVVLKPIPESSAVSPKSPLRSPLSPRSPTVRKSTADISPYLSRPQVEVPLSARRLQQLALLESVADESARMTPAFNSGPSRVPSIPEGPQRFGPSFHQPMPSQPPFYQTGQTHAPHMLNSFPPAPFGKPGYPQGQFMARSQTSQALHRMGHHGPPGSMSMNQHQLLSLINGGGPGNFGPPPPPPGPPPLHPMPHPNNFGIQPMYPGPQPMRGPPPHLDQGGLPPNSNGYISRPRPYSTAPMAQGPMPPMPPFATKPHNPSANALLSLLNSASTPMGGPTPSH